MIEAGENAKGMESGRAAWFGEIMHARHQNLVSVYRLAVFLEEIR